MIVFAAMYNLCTYESSYGVLSLHLTLKGAQAALNEEKRKVSKEYDDKVPEWVQFKVETMEVLP